MNSGRVSFYSFSALARSDKIVVIPGELRFLAKLSLVLSRNQSIILRNYIIARLRLQLIQLQSREKQTRPFHRVFYFSENLYDDWLFLKWIISSFVPNRSSWPVSRQYDSLVWKDREHVPYAGNKQIEVTPWTVIAADTQVEQGISAENYQALLYKYRRYYGREYVIS